MKVLDDERFFIYIYREVGQPHHLPHCHVRWENKDTVVGLPLGEEIVGPPLPKAGRLFLLTHIEEICTAWNNINPERMI